MNSFTHFYPLDAAPPTQFFAVTTLAGTMSTESSIGIGVENHVTNVYRNTDFAGRAARRLRSPASTAVADAGDSDGGGSDGVLLSCSWNNTAGETRTFGDSLKTNERCFAWGYYAPSVGSDDGGFHFTFF